MMIQQQTPAASSRIDGNNPAWKVTSGAEQNCGPPSEAPMADPGSLDITAGLARFKSSSATGSGNLAPSCSAPSSAVERAKIRNKTAQSRFRARQKAGRRLHTCTLLAHVCTCGTPTRRCYRAQARAETLEAMLLLTTIELRQMQSKQEPLEKRIRMLEMLVNANSTTSNPAPPASSGQVCLVVLSRIQPRVFELQQQTVQLCRVRMMCAQCMDSRLSLTPCCGSCLTIQACKLH